MIRLNIGREHAWRASLAAALWLGHSGPSTCGASGAFVDVAAEAGVVYVQQESVDSEVETHLQSGGAVAADFDGDGLTDIFATRMQLPDKLYRNLGAGPDGVVRFEDVSERAGFIEATNSNGAVAIDIENDGDLDLYVTTLYDRRFVLYLNDGDGRFAKDGGIRGANLLSDTPHLGFSVSAGDYDQDGWADLHTNEWSIDLASATIGQHSALLRNFGKALPGRFSNATSSAGVTLRGSLNDPTRPIQFAFASSFADFDGDGWQDLMVVADFGSSQLFWNQGDGTFVEGTQEAGVGLEQNGMGLAIGDVNNDGRADFFVSSIGDHKLYLNRGDRKFEELAEERIERLSGWGWGCSFADLDNDEDLDLVMTTGYEDLRGEFSTVRSVSPTRVWRNDGGFFKDVGEDWGVADDGPGKGLMILDYDQNGAQDIFIVNSQSEPILYRNELDTGNDWIQLELRGRESNRFGLGAKISVQASETGPTQSREIVGGSNYLAQNEMLVHFGLGELAKQTVHSARIEWPGGAVQELGSLEANRRHVVWEPLSYEDWRDERFLAEEIAEGIGDRDQDPDGDGLVNVAEYGLGRDPAVEDWPSDSLLSLAITRAELVIGYSRLSQAREAEVFVEQSNDLTNWERVTEGGFRVEADRGSGLEKVFLSLGLPDERSRFFRVKVAERE